MATWPVGLPTFQEIQKGSYREQRLSNVIRSPNTAGPPKTRRRFTSVSTRFQGNMRMSSAQFAIFETFFEDTIKDGSLEFDATHPRTGAAVVMLFQDSPPVVMVGIDYVITLDILILP